MKRIFISVILMLMATAARAERAQMVMEVIQSTITVNVVSVSSYTGTQIDPNSIALTTRAFISVQNLDADYDVYCSQKASVTTSTGFMIPMNGGMVTIPLMHGSEWAWNPTKANRLTLYCISNHAGSSSNVAVIQGY